MVESTGNRLVQRLGRFPGIDNAQWHRGRVAIEFAKDLDGTVARLVWLRVAERFGLAVVAHGWVVSEQQGQDCSRAMYYSSDYFSSPDYLPNRDAATAVRQGNLFSQLCRIYIAIEERIERAAGMPFNVWANGLSVLDKETIGRGEFVERTVLSERAVRVVLRNFSTLGWITLAGGGKRQQIGLTRQGAEVRQRIEAAMVRVSSDLLHALGEHRAMSIVNGLAACIESIAYALPRGLTGYGPGDSSITGGRYIAAQWEPHFIPAHGEQWPVVRRSPGESATGESLPTLLARTLARFIIDYDQINLGCVVDAYKARGFPDDGLPLPEAKRRFDVKGTGRTSRERHFFIVTAIDGGVNRRAYLTPKGKTERDALGWGLEHVEMAWRHELGDDTLKALQEGLARALDHSLPEAAMEPVLYPSRWFRRLLSLAAAAR